MRRAAVKLEKQGDCYLVKLDGEFFAKLFPEGGGYRGYLPTPYSTNGVTLGVASLARYKAEVTKLNREFAAKRAADSIAEAERLANHVDVAAEREGHLFLFTPITQAAKDWLTANVWTGTMRGETVCLSNPKDVAAVTDGLMRAGLRIKSRQVSNA